MVGYSGPIIMSMPTRAIVPFMLEDMRKIFLEAKGSGDGTEVSKENEKSKDSNSPENKGPFVLFSQEQINLCMKKVSIYL